MLSLIVIIMHGINTEIVILGSGSKPQSHDPDILVELEREFVTIRERKAADQHLSATQNLLTEVLATAAPAINVDLPAMESMCRIVQRSRDSSSRRFSPSSTALKCQLYNRSLS